jgi:Putative Flp pilus-assembly TadE/G-like
MILVAMAMVAIIAMAALSIDVVTLYLSRMEAQRAADAGALGAAKIISLSGINGDPSNTSGDWAQICGGSTGTATEAAYAAATQTINRVAPTTAQITVNYSANGAAPNASCVGLTNFGVNPEVTVQVTRTSLPTFFSRVWGNTGNTVTATATAEAFNPSNSASVTGGNIIPVRPRCVKPWIVPNYDPLNPNNSCTAANCANFVNTTTGQIVNPGISTGGGNANGVIGETFWLAPDCHHTGGNCTTRVNPPQPNYYPSGPVQTYLEAPPSVQYLPGQAPATTPVAVPSCSYDLDDNYAEAIAGCDQTTQYKCGSQLGNTVDLSENPVSSNDTTDGVACLIHEGSPTAGQPDGQDTLSPFAAPSSFPFQMEAGSANPLISGNLSSGTQITASNSIVSLPIYDQTNPATINGTGTTTVTIVGFLQVFINSVDQWGNVNVTVLNVAGCGNGTKGTGTALAGSSPVPVRLITPP